MYRYETHLHTAPVSRCARSTVAEMLALYAGRGYDGVFITNHFIDGNINIARDAAYRDKLDFYFSDYYAARDMAPSYGLKVFLGVESSYGGTDFLIYGLTPEWYYAHPEWLEMKKSDQLRLFAEHGAFLIQAHPYREADYIDHIRLFPRLVEGVEIINASRPEFENRMAKLYAEQYGLIPSAGSDRHTAVGDRIDFAGIETERPLLSVDDFIAVMRAREAKLFTDTLLID